MKYTTSVLAFLTILLIASCGDSPFSPKSEQPGKSGRKPGTHAGFAPVKITISGIGSDNISASALSIAVPEPALGSNIAASYTPLATIQIEAVSTGSFTNAGQRYIYATYKVRNADKDGNAYGQPLNNLTFMAVDTDGTIGSGGTYGKTAVAGLRLFDRTLLAETEGTDLAKQVIPTGRVNRKVSGGLEPAIADVLQVYTETEAGEIETEIANAGLTVKDVFPYGFVTRSPNKTPGSREIPVPAGANDFDGVVTFAFKLPLQAQANADPFEISIMFVPVEDSETRITQSLEEQNAAGRAAFKQRANELTFLDEIMLLPGTGYVGSQPAQLLCEVRVAGADSDPNAVFMVQSSGFSSLYPNPYRGAGHHIADNPTFTTNFNLFTCQSGSWIVNKATFVVQGFQSGKQFTSQTYPSVSGGTISTPSTGFFPGEKVEVTLTSGLGISKPIVARYRVAVNKPGGNTSFTNSQTVPSGILPLSITSGDWNGDGDLDLAVSTDAGTLLTLENSGGMFLAPSTPIAVGSDPLSVIAGDWDGDGDLDLAVSTRAGTLLTFENNGGTFSAPSTPISVGTLAQSVIAGDWDSDGDLDLAVMNPGDPTLFVFGNISILFNSGGGVFTSVATITSIKYPVSITSGDWDGDGDLDLAATNVKDNFGVSYNVSVLENSGGTFSAISSPIAVGDNPLSVIAGDWDGEGDLDLAVSTDAGTLLTFENSGGSFSAPSTPITTGGYLKSVIAGDWDGDGDLDLVTADNNSDNLPILFNNSGSFTISSPLAAGDAPTSITAGDWDGDGDLDLAVTNYFSQDVSILKNN